MTPSSLHVSSLSHLLARNMATLEQKLGIGGQRELCVNLIYLLSPKPSLFWFGFFPEVQPPGG